MTFQDYSLCGQKIRVDCQEARQARAIHQLLTRFFALELADKADEDVTLLLRFLSPGQALKIPSPVEEIFHTPKLRGAKTNQGFHLQSGPSSGSSSIFVNPTQGCATGKLTTDFWNQSLHDQREFFLLPLVMLLHAREFFPLHANGVVNQDRGVLIVGDPGDGKTTLTVSLLKAGWKFLSDDVVCLNGSAEGIEALALRRGLSCTLDTLAHFPQLGAGTSEFAPLDDRKRYIESSDTFGAGSSQRCLPRLVLFPQIEQRRVSQLKPIGQSRTLGELGKQSGWSVADVELARAQMKVLVALMAQAKAYQILLGGDVFQNPDGLNDLIRATMNGEL